MDPYSRPCMISDKAVLLSSPTTVSKKEALDPPKRWPQSSAKKEDSLPENSGEF